MKSLAVVSLLCAFLAAAAFPADAASEGEKQAPAKSRTARPKRLAPSNARPDADLPCPRAAWKEDPVCFGEGDPGGLPTPSGRSAERPQGGRNEAAIKPVVNLNNRLNGPGVIYKHDGNAVTSDFGGGVGLQLPF